ncbi:ParM/StbA family protein [Gloeomargaritales cyanobacterium VI4D9]|nr:ParM/StbA family protein [Gloeomargaritales cyanobacterium VI4D9]
MTYNKFAGSPTLLSVDLGRTSTKTCVSSEPEEVIIIPANVAPMTVEQVRQGRFEGGAPLLDLWVEYHGRAYAIGHLAADFGAGLGRGQTRDTLVKTSRKVEDALVKIFACIGYFDLSGDLAVSLGLPYLSQEQFDTEKRQLVAQLQAPHALSYRGRSLTINITKVWVMPEGFGSLVWCHKMAEKRVDFTNLHVAVIDIGHQTTDMLKVDKFHFARGTSRSEEFGMSQFYDQVAAQIKGANSEDLTLIEAVHQPEGKRFYRPRGEKPMDLDLILPRLREIFAKELWERVRQWLPSQVTDVIITGGGGGFFWDDFAPLLQEYGLTPHLANPSRTANALGQYVYGQVQLSKDKGA